MAANLSAVLVYFLAIAPLFLLTVKGWSSAILIIAFLVSLMVLIADRFEGRQLAPNRNRWLLSVALTFAFPVIAIFLGQWLRHDFLGRAYDSPARFTLAIPILWVLVRHRLDVLRPMTLLLPAAMLLTLAFVLLFPDQTWGARENFAVGRTSTPFADPLTFGSLNLTLGLCSLLSIDLYGRDALWQRVLKGSGFAVGLYLSIASGSRTGWLALPLVLLVWVHIRLKGYRLLTYLALTVAFVGIYWSSATLRQRLGLAVGEFVSYRWNAVNPVSSVGDRLSFLRMAAFLFEQSPWAGFGDRNFAGWIGNHELNRYALVKTQEFALRSGFHNELATNAVRSGIWGLLASVLLFLVPLTLFLRYLRNSASFLAKAALFGLAYTLCTLITGMTTEVFNLKFTASFHALMFASLVGTLLARRTHDRPYQDHES